MPPPAEWTYQRDHLGRITQQTETLAGVTTTYDYQYDATGRLVDVSVNVTLLNTYAYDANGNRGEINGQVVATYDEQDRLLTYLGNSYTYSDNGELTGKTNAGQTTQYHYDVFGNLNHVTLPNGITIDYVVDGQQRRRHDCSANRVRRWGNGLGERRKERGHHVR